MRVAFSSMDWNTGSRSPGDELMTLQHLRRGRLLLQRLPQFIEQPRVLDGDDGLSGEVLHQRDLLVGERPNFLAVDDDGADQFIILEHRERRATFARRPSLCGRRNQRAFRATLFSHIGDVLTSFCRHDAIERRPGGAGTIQRSQPLFDKLEAALPSIATARNRSALEPVQRPELGLANAGRVLQHGLETGSNSPGDELMTRSTSAVAVCCSSDFAAIR